jgi:hypothetical protein
VNSPVRPRGLTETTVLMCITNAMGWLIIDWTAPRAGTVLLVNTIFIFLGYFVLWFYWRGRNWARIFVLLNSLVALFNLVFFRRSGTIARVMYVSEAAIAIFLLYWLNRSDVKAFFRAGKQAVTPESPG